jgi:GTPase SAR1 family protein
MINKQLLDLLSQATVNGADNVFVELVSFARLAKSHKTVKGETYASCGVDGVEKTKEVKTWLEGRGYIEALIGLVQWMIRADDDGVPEALIILDERGDDSLGGKFFGDPVELTLFKEKVESYQTKTEGITMRVAQAAQGGMFGGGNSVQFDQEFVPLDELVLARQSFYPWLSVSLDDYFKAYMESDQSVLVLYGPPGTGKSTFIRTFFKYIHDHHKEMIGHLAYDPDVIGSIDLINRFMRSNATVMAYEDMDAWLGPREGGNLFMSTLLNQTQGVVRRKHKKLIFSTNLSNTSKIDEALLRVGRCFDILEFSKLSGDQASTIIHDMAREEKHFDNQKEWTLAEVLAAENTAVQSVNRFGKKPGFR